MIVLCEIRTQTIEKRDVNTRNNLINTLLGVAKTAKQNLKTDI